MSDFTDEAEADYGEHMADELGLFDALLAARPFVKAQTYRGDRRASKVLTQIDRSIADYRKRLES